MWPDLAIFWTLSNFLKPLAAINLPKSPTFLGKFCKGVKIFHFSSEIIFGNFIEIWRFSSGHTASKYGDLLKCYMLPSMAFRYYIKTAHYTRQNTALSWIAYNFWYCQCDQIGRILKVLVDMLELPKCMLTFWAILKKIVQKKEVSVDNFWVTLWKFGLLFISTSGHTGHCSQPATSSMVASFRTQRTRRFNKNVCRQMLMSRSKENVRVVVKRTPLLCTDLS